jgi:hypothetical protein
MLRIYFLRQCSIGATRVPRMLWTNRPRCEGLLAPYETTLCKFRHLLQQHEWLSIGLARLACPAA